MKINPDTVIKSVLWFCLNLQQSTTQLLSPSSLVGWGGESEGTRQKLGGWGESSFTEWQREKKTATNTTGNKHTHHAGFSPPDAQLAPEEQKPLLQPAPP